jgi:Tol biopolymer transport system component
MKTKTHILALFLIVLISSCNNEEVSGPSGNVEYTQIDFDAAWSKSGKMIAFIHNDLEAELSGLYIMDTSGNNKRQLVSGNVNSPDWSMGDTAIIFDNAGALLIVNVSSGIVRTIEPGPNSHTGKWNPINNRIAYISNSDLYLSEPAGAGRTLIMTSCAWPAWSPDGRYLFFFRPSQGSSGTRNGDTLYRYDSQTGMKFIVNYFFEEGYRYNSHLSISEEKAYFSSVFYDGSAHVYDYHFDNYFIDRIVNSLSYSPDFDPVSGRLIYTNRERGDGRLWIRETNGTSRELTY